MNNSNSTSKKELGPIWPGTYNMFPNEKPNKEGWWALQEQGWNKFSSLLFKAELKRGGANLHLGQVSHGCITVNYDSQNQYQYLSDLLNKESGNNVLVVYP